MPRKIQSNFLCAFTTRQPSWFWPILVALCLQNAPAVAVDGDQLNPGETTLEQKFIESNIETSEWFDSIADKIDIFLAGKRLTKSQNETSVSLENRSYIIEREPFENTTSMGVNLRLPNLEQYWNLKFTNYDESRERGVKDTQLRQAPRQRNYGASVGVFRQLGKVRTSFRPRVELQSPFKVSHSLVFESSADYPNYQVHPKLEFFANGDQGVGTFQGIDFNFPLNKEFSIAWINEGEYEDHKHLYSVTNGTSLNQVFTKKISLAYGIFFSSINQPNYHLEAYTLSITWSQLIYRKILDFQIAPQLNFSRGSDFTGVPGLVAQFRINF